MIRIDSDWVAQVVVLFAVLVLMAFACFAEG